MIPRFYPLDETKRTSDACETLCHKPFKPLYSPVIWSEVQVGTLIGLFFPFSLVCDKQTNTCTSPFWESNSENLNAHSPFFWTATVAEVAQPGRALDLMRPRMGAKLKTELSPVQTRPSAPNSLILGLLQRTRHISRLILLGVFLARCLVLKLYFEVGCCFFSLSIRVAAFLQDRVTL